MRHCCRCRVSFEEEDKKRCVYCKGPLATKNIFEIQAQKKLVVKDREALTHERKVYLFGAFFRTQTFLSSYVFCVFDAREGRQKKRFWIQPLNMSFFIKLPWLVIDLFYSIFFHFFYSGYCPKCNMKYASVSSGLSHSEEECAYNQEYNEITQELFSGKLLVSLKNLEEKSLQKRSQGKRSAYFDFMSRGEGKTRGWDILAILISLGFYIYLLTIMAMPIFARIYHF